MTNSAGRLTPVDVFAEVACPFTHVGLRRFVAERGATGVARPLVVRAWPLEWINGHPLEPEHVAAEVDALRTTVAPELFAGFAPATFPKTSIPAFGLAAAGYARDLATGEAVSLAIRDAIFERGLDVSDPDVLRAVGAPFDIEPSTASEAAASVDADWHLGQERAVRGSPHFFVDGTDWFCPTLDIHAVGDGFAVTFAASMRAFHDAAFR